MIHAVHNTPVAGEWPLTAWLAPLLTSRDQMHTADIAAELQQGHINHTQNIIPVLIYMSYMMAFQVVASIQICWRIGC